MHQLGNLEKIGEREYIVRTQAGFRKAIKQVKNSEYGEDTASTEGYPKVYPSYVRFSRVYNGGGYTLFASCSTLDQVESMLTRLLALISKHKLP